MKDVFYSAVENLNEQSKIHSSFSVSFGFAEAILHFPFMLDFLQNHWLDITTTILGLLYILLEVKASIWLWLVGFLMQTLGIVLYYQKGLYGDCGMEFYYLAMTVYGFLTWKYGRILFRKKAKADASSDVSPRTENIKAELPITHFPKNKILPWLIGIAALWMGIYLLLVFFTNSNVPLADSFTTALSVVGIWALAHKYLEQWYIWIVVDIVTSVLYFYKDIPFKASLYALYVVIAFFGVIRWKRQMQKSN